MKKQQQERSPRYRFWRNVGIITVSGLIGGVIGVLTGMFGSKTSIELQNLFDKEDLLCRKFHSFSNHFCDCIVLTFDVTKILLQDE